MEDEPKPDYIEPRSHPASLLIVMAVKGVQGQVQQADALHSDKVVAVEAAKGSLAGDIVVGKPKLQEAVGGGWRKRWI